MTSFTPENRAALLVRLERGQSMAVAAASSGIPLPTAKGWLAKGRRGGGAGYAAFAEAVANAREIAARVAPPMDEKELRSHVSAAARKGSVTAMKLLWAMLQDGDPVEDAGEDTLAALDELAAAFQPPLDRKNGN